jgi:hypothetical protein
VLVLSVTGCSDFDEMKSQRALIEANKLLEQGEEFKAEAALSELVVKYPQTQAAEVAAKSLYRIKRQREFRERKEFAKILDSYQQVLAGYHALYAEYPGTIAELDQSGYFFDKAYLDEITPDGYRVYLWLKEDGSGYGAWSVAVDKPRGYAIESSSRTLFPFERDAMINMLKSDFQASSWDDKLIILQTVSP